MLVRESGVVLLKDLLETCRWSLYHDIPQLAERVINRCERFAADGDYVTDDDHDTNAMNEWNVSNSVACFR